jgi:hypothetical protein
MPALNTGADFVSDTDALASEVNARFDAIETWANVTLLDGTNIANDAIDTQHIADDAVGQAQLADNSVGQAKIIDGAVAASKMADNAVGEEEITTALAEKLGVSESSTVRRGEVSTSGEESRTSTSYGTLTTPDQVDNIVLPADGLIVVAYDAIWKSSVAAAGRAAIFLNTTQLQVNGAGFDSPRTQAAALTSNSTANRYAPLNSFSMGLVSGRGLNTTHTNVTTGQAVGQYGGTSNLAHELNGTVLDVTEDSIGGPCLIYAAAGTYDVSVRFKSSSGSVSVKDRKLWVWTVSF